MQTFIRMEYFVALALIQLNKEEISLSELNDYRINVAKELERNKISSIILFSDFYALQLVRDYSDCFELTQNQDAIKRKVENNVLISKFISYLSDDILKAVFAQNKKKACQKILR